MKKVTLLILASVLMLAGCTSKENATSQSDSASEPEISSESSSEESSSEEIIEDLDVDITTSASLSGRSKSYPITFTYNSAYFNQPSDEFNKDIAMLSFGLSLTTGSRTAMYNFLNDLRFKDLYFSSVYYDGTTEDSIGYSFAHKAIGKQHLVLVTVRGCDYGLEWSSNLKLGKEGNHEGFNEAAEMVVNDLDTYLKKHNQESPKVLITGYSRGGAVANVASDILLQREESKKLFKDEDLYSYTFETPRGCAEAREYKNVFNIINSMDLIPSFAPAEYGMYRCGVDVDIVRTDVDDLMKEYDADFVLPAFTPEENTFKTEQEFIAYILKSILTNDTDTRPIMTRAQFVDNAQPTLQYFLKMFFCLKQSTVNKLSSDLSEKDAWTMFTIISSGQALHDFFKPYLDEDGYQYDDDELLTRCNEVSELLIQGPFVMLVAAFAAYKDNLMRVIDIHYLDVNYVLLNAYDPYAK